MTPSEINRPELLSPAGDFDCARAAVENGADAVYFGLRVGLNARTKAANFALEELPEFMAYLHLRGVRGFVTLNTLVFPSELDLLERSLRAAVSAGVDAAIVQDFGAARLIRSIAPDFPLHASTQMSITSAEGAAMAQRLGVCRVVLARELSLDDLRRIRPQTALELEVFVHGALCMSYSGQCNASFGMGGRSANRGQCAQQCRLPYDLVCDNEVRDLKDRKYLLSPSDLAALDLVPELIAAGVNALKIEGRMKSPQYVASTTRQYRLAIDEALAGRRVSPPPEQLLELESPFSRGLSQGWLAGRNLQIVDGRNSANRGICIGKVAAVRGDRVAVELTAALRRGDGVAFPSNLGEAHDQGGRVYEIFDRGQSVKEVVGGNVELAFGSDALDLNRLQPGQELWKTDDPQIDRRLRKTFANGRAQRRVPLDLTVEAAVGRKLRVSVRAGTGVTCRVESDQELDEAQRHPLTAEVLREQFGRLGTSVYELRGLEARIEGRPMVPLSVLGQLRHEMVRLLDAAAVEVPKQRLLPRPELPSGRIGFQPVSIEITGLARPLPRVEASGRSAGPGREEHRRRFCRVAALRPCRADGPREGRGDLPGDAADPEAGRGGPLRADCRRQARRPSGPQPGRGGLLCPAADPLRGRHVAQCGQPVDRGLAARARRTPGHGGLRLRSPAAQRTGRRRPLGRIGSGRLPAPSLVPHGTLRFRHRGRRSAQGA